MTIQRVDELTTEPVVGKYYLVPCAVDLPYAKAHPIFGLAHRDVEFFNFDVEHFHNDVRFMTLRFLHLVCNEEFWRYEEDWAARVVLTQVFRVDVPRRFEYRRMKCVRQMPDFFNMLHEKNAQNLEAAFANKPLNCGKCPHRGTDLRSMPTENGVTVCPSHGLCADVKEQKIVTRAAAEKIVARNSK